MHNDPSVVYLGMLKEWLEKEAKNDDIKEFIVFEGGYLLFTILAETERLQRGEGLFMKRIRILQIVQLLLDKQQEKQINFDIMDNILNIRDSITTIFFNISAVNVEITWLVLNILIKLFYAKEASYRFFLTAIKEYKREFKTKY